MGTPSDGGKPSTWEKECSWCGRTWTAVQGQWHTYGEITYATDPDFPDQRVAIEICPQCAYLSLMEYVDRMERYP